MNRQPISSGRLTLEDIRRYRQDKLDRYTDEHGNVDLVGMRKEIEEGAAEFLADLEALRQKKLNSENLDSLSVI
jgi:hypothetical protein